MGKKLIYFTINLFFLIISSFAISQPIASFTSSVTFGCTPVTNITFRSNSTGCSGNMTYHWVTRNSQNQVLDERYNNTEADFSYTQSGTYSISLTVTCNGQSDTYTTHINIYNSPTVNTIGAPLLKGCVRFFVDSFSDYFSITEGDGPIASRIWYFGDGVTSTDPNPEHTYNHPALRSVSLVVQDVNGCTAEATKEDFISISSPPVISFEGDPIENCSHPHTVRFTPIINSEHDISNYNFEWSFGDNSSGTGNPGIHTYNSFGEFSVILTATDRDGHNCASTYTEEDYIIIQPASMRPSDFSSPRGTLCQNSTYSFRNNTDSECLWNFGDGTTSTESNSLHGYTTPGEYTITFSKNIDNPACRVDTSYTVTVEEVYARYTTDPENAFSCTVPLSITFTSEHSPNVVLWEYYLHEEDTIRSPTASTTYVEGRFAPELYVRTASGCEYRYRDSVIVFNSMIDFDGELNGCAPFTTEFNCSNFTFPYNEVVEVNWYFNNRGPNNSDVIQMESCAPVSVEYAEPGLYTPLLEVKRLCVVNINRTEECYISKTKEVKVGTSFKPQIMVIAPSDTLCPQDTVMVQYIASHDTCGYECETSYTWFSYGEARSKTDAARYNIMEWQFDHDTGWVSLILRIDHNGCKDSVKLENVKYILPPVLYPEIEFITSCEDPLHYLFSIYNDGADYLDWIVYYQRNIIHEERKPPNETIFEYTFPNTGYFTIEVRAYNEESGCIFKKNIPVDISPPVAIILSDTIVCKHLTLGLFGEFSENALYYRWDFGDGNSTPNSTIENTTHRYLNAGVYIVTLTVTDINGCEHSTTQKVHVVENDFNVITEMNGDCNIFNVQFNVVPIGNDSIIGVQWRFHDSSTQNGDTAYYTYTTQGDFYIKVIINSAYCGFYEKELPGFINWTIPFADFYVDSIHCSNNNINFSALYKNDNCLYKWDFGDGTTSSEIGSYDISHNYANAGLFNIELIVDDQMGCVVSKKLESVLSVINIISDYTINNFVNCYPVGLEINSSVLIEPDSLINEVVYKWDIGYGDPLYEMNPEIYYPFPGEFDITFYVIAYTDDEHFCIDSTTTHVSIFGPTADAFIDKNSICLGDSIFFRIDNLQDVDNFEWVVGEGNKYTIEEFYHIYDSLPSIGYYPVTLTLYSSHDTTTCKVILVNENIHIYDINADFQLLDSYGNEVTEGVCSPINLLLQSNSTQNSNHNWYLNEIPFGNNATSIETVLENPGVLDETNIICLIVNNHIGCKDTLYKSVDVYPVPKIKISNDTLICEGDEIMLYAEGGTICNWSPDKYISDTNTYTPLIKPENDIVYTAKVSTERGCYDTDNIFIKVHNEPVITFDTTSITIIIGESTEIYAESDQEKVVFTWSPNYKISCLHCESPTLAPLETTRYFLTTVDSLQCFTKNYSINIIVDEFYALDVPMAFTPASDDENSIVYVRGYGIKDLLQFRIYNRWGEEVFFSSDLSYGWNGHFNGKLQNMDNYGYFVEAEMYNGAIVTKKGYIMLIR